MSSIRTMDLGAAGLLEHVCAAGTGKTLKNNKRGTE